MNNYMTAWQPEVRGTQVFLDGKPLLDVIAAHPERGYAWVLVPSGGTPDAQFSPYRPTVLRGVIEVRPVREVS